ncbi:ABC-type transport auxiliary lipoprotein family protein [Candidatus Raskinella chloraquaticus]|uniref:ABC-type transport auxiliary lipoprotein component domain-containing protein n=1 Tax=Candidatus Raskinella chloraquaticus TaxID=1951219 RepID=A0A1W9HRJ7_9HYPH|nr:MAG: hypothetical protein A4S15_01220 [Proteobacteria bacterium SG_bin8]
MTRVSAGDHYVTRRWFLLAVPAGLAGCSAGGGVGGLISPPPLETYDLSSPKVSSTGSGRRGTVAIAESSAVRALDTDRILVKPRANEINYLAGAQWADRLPRLVQSRIVTTFENARRLNSVVRPGEGIDAATRLVTEIRSFELDLLSSPKVQIELTARLVGNRNGQVIAAEIFSGQAPVSGSEPAVVVAALDKTMSDVLLRLVAWADRHS